jgi:uncharacterized protein (DUF1684 family)
VTVPELELADWRDTVASLYLSDVDLAGFRLLRDQLFATHPQSPIPADERGGFHGLRYYPPNAGAVAEVELERAEGEIQIDTGGEDGVVTYRRGHLRTPRGPLTPGAVRLRRRPVPSRRRHRECRPTVAAGT